MPNNAIPHPTYVPFYEVRTQIRDQVATPVIPRKKHSNFGNDGIDWCLYQYRHLAENVFARLKHFRAIARQYDKLNRNF